MTRWAIVTGEYPPQFGGVSDYTRLIATGLAAAGDAVAIYCPPHRDPPVADLGVSVHRLPDHFGPRGLLELDVQLRRKPRPDCILIQYVPHAYGWKAMNWPFTTWVAQRAKWIAPVWVMFHEVMSGAGRNRPFRNAVLSTMTRQMARQLAQASSRVFVSIPHWASLLKGISLLAKQPEWLPVPSNIPAIADPTKTKSLRQKIVEQGEVIGHFGTFGGMNADLLPSPLIVLLSKSPTRRCLLIGRGSGRFAEQLIAREPGLRKQVVCAGEVPASEAAAYLAVCDLLIQPYPDGASSRRGSLMAGLALGIPIVTNLGFLSEPIWGKESAGVTVVPSPEPGDLVKGAEELLALPPEERSRRGREAAAWYRSRFAPELTVTCLRAARAADSAQVCRP